MNDTLKKMLEDLEAHSAKLEDKVRLVRGTNFFVVVVNDAYVVGVDNEGLSCLAGYMQPYLMTRSQAAKVMRETSYTATNGDRFKARETVSAARHFERMLAQTQDTINRLKNL